MLRSILIALGCVTISVGAYAQPADTEQEWKHFRTAHPYHIQTLALGEPDAAGARTLIISEPPPDIDLERLKTLWTTEFARAEIFKHPVGVNGWVADIVTRLPRTSDTQTQAFLRELSGTLFGTSY